jgi:LmbE family N-acetylglucosaminyl deacetylase
VRATTPVSGQDAPVPTPYTPFPDDWSRALAVVAHPDDLEYGAAGAVARWTAEGRTVTYLLVTRGEAGIDTIPPAECGPLREAEQRAAARIVGVDVVEFLDHRDGVVEGGLGLRRDIARAIRRHRPDIIVTGSYEIRMVGGMTNQADHRVVGLATLDAARDAGNRWIFPELADEGLEPWGGVQAVFVANSPFAAHGVDVTEYLDRGVASLVAHDAYIKGLGRDDFDPEEFLESLARHAGTQLGCKFAVSFETLRLAPPASE